MWNQPVSRTYLTIELDGADEVPDVELGSVEEPGNISTQRG